MPPIQSTRDIIIQTPDLAAARAFYEGVLGLPVFMDQPHMIGLETGGLRLFVEEAPAFGPVLEFLVDDLAATKARLLAAGCRLDQEDPSIPRCYFTDPFGLSFNIGERTPKATP
jgi:catechol 2,3-dioxygenase-like lactoylglutathione lyase family enzyme